MHMYIYMYGYVYVQIYMYIYIYIWHCPINCLSGVSRKQIWEAGWRVLPGGLAG